MAGSLDPVVPGQLVLKAIEKFQTVTNVDPDNPTFEPMLAEASRVYAKKYGTPPVRELGNSSGAVHALSDEVCRRYGDTHMSMQLSDLCKLAETRGFERRSIWSVENGGTREVATFERARDQTYIVADFGACGLSATWISSYVFSEDQRGLVFPKGRIVTGYDHCTDRLVADERSDLAVCRWQTRVASGAFFNVSMTEIDRSHMLEGWKPGRFLSVAGFEKLNWDHWFDIRKAMHPAQKFSQVA